MRTLPLITLISVFFIYSAEAQINYTANDAGSVPSYQGIFRFGTNMGYYGPSWNDASLSDIAAGNSALNVKGAGVKTLRVFLPESFLETWGYNIRVSEFNHYNTLGAIDNVVALEDPSSAHKDNTHFNGCADESRLWKNLYDPIWDGGTNGTPVNDNNYFALYVYNTVTRYKSVTKFWEIINEPDLDIGGHGWQDAGSSGNWWQNNPSPCDLPNLRAPIFYYVRLLHVAYEVIKTVDPSAYVAPGGLGYASFLDALLRNTENPVDGSVTGTYPLKGGAYFDCLSFHEYPSYSLKTWDNNAGGFVQRRHSDAAVQEYINQKNAMAQVLVNYGYDNITYPSKIFICTESNISRLSFDNGGLMLIGSDAAQKNYLMKTLVQSYKNSVVQFYSFVLGDAKYDYEATQEYDVMGLYKKLEGAGPLSNGGTYNQQYSNSGIAYKTTSDLLWNKQYDASRTAQLNLPSGIEGAAFHDQANNYTYVLWAKTTQDNSESASASYTFPAGISVPAELTRRDWDFSSTGINTQVNSSSILLSGTPIFLMENIQLVDLHDPIVTGRPSNHSFSLKVYPLPADQNVFLSFELTNPEKVSVKIFDIHGRMVREAISSQKYSTGKHQLPVDTGNLNSGAYILQFRTEKMIISKKLVVAH